MPVLVDDFMTDGLRDISIELGSVLVSPVWVHTADVLLIGLFIRNSHISGVSFLLLA